MRRTYRKSELGYTVASDLRKELARRGFPEEETKRLLPTEEIRQKVQTLLPDWEVPGICKENCESLLGWAEERLKKARDDEIKPSGGIRVGNKIMYGPHLAQSHWSGDCDPDVVKLVDKIRLSHWGSKRAPFDMLQFGNSYSKAVEAARSWILSFGQEGRLTTIRFPLPSGVYSDMYVPVESVVAQVWMDCTKLARESGWWETSEALVYVLIGGLPPAGVTVTLHRRGNGLHAITISSRGVVHKSEILRAYDHVTKKHRIRAKLLSAVQAALLSLVEVTPGKSWTERLKVYDEWRRKHPELPKYEEPNRVKMLRTEYKRALKKAFWESY